MRKEIVLPPHLYDRIKASAGEHGGIGRDKLFSEGGTGVPLCAHGHAWGTCTRYLSAPNSVRMLLNEPELMPFLSWTDNDDALIGAGVAVTERIPFALWAEILNVKRGKDEDYVQPESSAELQAAS